jgi:hypothetical protein
VCLGFFRRQPRHKKIAAKNLSQRIDREKVIHSNAGVYSVNTNAPETIERSISQGSIVVIAVSQRPKMAA